MYSNALSDAVRSAAPHKNGLDRARHTCLSRYVQGNGSLVKHAPWYCHVIGKWDYLRREPREYQLTVVRAFSSFLKRASSYSQRRAATRALVSAVLFSTKKSVRHAALTVLAYAPKDATQLMGWFVQRTFPPQLRLRAALAIAKLDPKLKKVRRHVRRLVTPISILHTHWDPLTRARIVPRLVQQVDPALAIHALVAAFAFDNCTVRNAATENLAKLIRRSPVHAVTALNIALRNQHRTENHHLRLTFGNVLHTPRTVSSTIGSLILSVSILHGLNYEVFLRSDGRPLRWGRPYLLSALKSTSPTTRKKAAHLLGTLKDRSARRSLSSLKRHDPSLSVRAAAALALERMGTTR